MPPSPRRPGRPPLDRDRVLTVALALVDAGGAEALTLRALATQLGSSTATLYRHYADRAELVAAVIDHALGEIDPPRTSRWQDDCTAMATSLFATLVRHPGLARLLAGTVPQGPNAQAFRVRAVTTLLDNGFDQATALRVWSTVGHYVIGFAVQDGSDDEEDISAPAAITSIPLAEEFEFGLGLIIRGLEAGAHEGS